MKINYDYNHSGDFEMKVTTFFGLEEILARELMHLVEKRLPNLNVAFL